jgi:hypothetical protein
MTLVEIMVWGGFCLLILSCVFKRFNLPKIKLIPPITLVMLLYVIPLLSLWGNSSAINFIYGIFLLIMLISLVLSWFLFKNQKMLFCFFLGVVGTFSVFWAIPKGFLPYRPGWEERSSAFFEKILVIRAPLHHSTLFPLVAAIILLFHYWRPSSRVFRWCSKHRWVYALGLGFLIFAIISQIPEICEYQTPWW